MQNWTHYMSLTLPDDTVNSVRLSQFFLKQGFKKKRYNLDVPAQITLFRS